MLSVNGIFHHKLKTISETINFVSRFRDIFWLLQFTTFSWSCNDQFIIEQKLKQSIPAQIWSRSDHLCDKTSIQRRHHHNSNWPGPRWKNLIVLFTCMTSWVLDNQMPPPWFSQQHLVTLAVQLFLIALFRARKSSLPIIQFKWTASFSNSFLRHSYLELPFQGKKVVIVNPG